MAQSKFFHFFPVPSFLRMPAAGLSISDDAIRFMRFDEDEEELRLDGYGEAKVPSGSIVNGNVASKDAVVRALSDMRKKNQLKLVRATIPDDKVYLFKINLPAIPESDIRSALEFKIEENVPISLSETVFDYVVVGGAPKGTMDVIVAAVHVKLVSSYVDILRSAGLQPLAIELESQAIASSIVPRGDSRVTLLVHFNEHSTGLFLVRSDVVQFSLTLPNDEGAAAPEAAPAKGGAAYQKLYSPKYKKLPMVREEMERIMNYWQGREQGIGQNEYQIIASGPDATDHEFMEYFSGLLKREVHVGNVWTNAFAAERKIPDLPKDDSFRYAAAIGVALSDYIRHRQ